MEERKKRKKEGTKQQGIDNSLPSHEVEITPNSTGPFQFHFFQIAELNSRKTTTISSCAEHWRATQLAKREMNIRKYRYCLSHEHEN
ncbi:hypothetical protein TNCT_356591 [Trichonephila clavata]|uniref:Uncharacterized protein n=1 Tax=Trichonephila clavata TaxID=2740835 RepID=A0A8X6HSS0_TRICU|nr:hypothetical protein TNCT_356591 [Trichonephila clavata]